MSETDRKRHFAILGAERKRTPWDTVLVEASQAIEKRQRRAGLQPPLPKPRVRVFQYNKGMALYVIRLGNVCITAETWTALIKKAAWGPWRTVRRTWVDGRWL
jgi:hypothetical protein